jgi:hypothetical protein
VKSTAAQHPIKSADAAEIDPQQAVRIFGIVVVARVGCVHANLDPLPKQRAVSRSRNTRYGRLE